MEARRIGLTWDVGMGFSGVESRYGRASGGLWEDETMVLTVCKYMPLFGITILWYIANVG